MLLESEKENLNLICSPLLTSNGSFIYEVYEN